MCLLVAFIFNLKQIKTATVPQALHVFYTPTTKKPYIAWGWGEILLAMLKIYFSCIAVTS